MLSYTHDQLSLLLKVSGPLALIPRLPWSPRYQDPWWTIPALMVTQPQARGTYPEVCHAIVLAVAVAP